MRGGLGDALEIASPPAGFDAHHHRKLRHAYLLNLAHGPGSRGDPAEGGDTPARLAPRRFLGEGEGEGAGGPTRHQGAAVFSQRHLSSGKRSPRPPAASVRLGIDERLGLIDLAHTVGYGVKLCGDAAANDDADAEVLPQVARD